MFNQTLKNKIVFFNLSVNIKNKANLIVGYFLQYLLSVSFSVILVPKLAQKIGFAEFGQIGKLISIASLLIVLINYSFSITSIPKIALENNLVKKQELYSVIFFSRLFLSIISILILYLVSTFFTTISNTCYSILVLFLFSTSLNSVWYLQAIQKFKMIIVLSVFGTLSSFTIFFTLNKINYFISIDRVLFIVILPQIIVNIFSFFFIYFKMKICIKFSVKETFDLIRNELLVFLSQFISSIYIMVGPIILNTFSNSYEAGVFSILDRIISLLLGGLLLFFSLLSPSLSISYVNEHNSYYKKLKEIVIFNFISIFILFLVFKIFESSILSHLFHSTNLNFSILMYLGFIYLNFTALGPIISNHLVLINKKNLIILLTSAILIVTFLCSFFLTGLYGSIGWLLSTIIGQSILLILIILILKKKYV
jgi:O-antigen/teichoic acid export membrane protein